MHLKLGESIGCAFTGSVVSAFIRTECFVYDVFPEALLAPTTSRLYASVEELAAIRALLCLESLAYLPKQRVDVVLVLLEVSAVIDVVAHAIAFMSSPIASWTGILRS